MNMAESNHSKAGRRKPRVWTQSAVHKSVSAAEIQDKCRKGSANFSLNWVMVLARGEVELDAPRSGLSLDNLMFHMAGGAGLNALQHELHRGEPAASAPAA
jgi:hypothetical protein